jgi:deoxyribodipyrimidine photolyase-like uncharacterized protein
MDNFSRASRQHFQVLMDGNKPIGGKLDTPKSLWFEPDTITQKVIAQVKSLSFRFFRT